MLNGAIKDLRELPFDAMMQLAKSLKSWLGDRASLGLKSQLSSLCPPFYLLSSVLMYYKLISHVRSIKRKKKPLNNIII